MLNLICILARVVLWVAQVFRRAVWAPAPVGRIRPEIESTVLSGHQPRYASVQLTRNDAARVTRRRAHLDRQVSSVAVVDQALQDVIRAAGSITS